MLTGGAGNDTLDGGAGDDTLVGGAGDDTYRRSTATGDIVDSRAAERRHRHGPDGARQLHAGANVENLTFIGAGNFTGTGNALANMITGGAGNDTLNGGAGADTLIGGAGNDTYIVDNAGDVVTENAGEGHRYGHRRRSTYTLGANVENLTSPASAPSPAPATTLPTSSPAMRATTP